MHETPEGPSGTATAAAGPGVALGTLDAEVMDELVEVLGIQDLQEVTGGFAAQLAVQRAGMREALKLADWTEIARLAHALKGGAGNLGARLLAAAALQLEQASLAADRGAALAALDELDLLASTTLEAMRQAGYLRPDAA